MFKFFREIKKDAAFSSPKAYVVPAMLVTSYAYVVFREGVPEWLGMLIYTLMWLHTIGILFAAVTAMIVSILLSRDNAHTEITGSAVESLHRMNSRTYGVGTMFNMASVVLIYMYGAYLVGAIMLVSTILIAVMVKSIREKTNDMVYKKLSSE